MGDYAARWMTHLFGQRITPGLALHSLQVALGVLEQPRQLRAPVHDDGEQRGETASLSKRFGLLMAAKAPRWLHANPLKCAIGHRTAIPAPSVIPIMASFTSTRAPCAPSACMAAPRCSAKVQRLSTFSGMKAIGQQSSMRAASPITSSRQQVVRAARSQLAIEARCAVKALHDP